MACAHRPARRQQNRRRHAHRPLMREQHVVWPAAVTEMLVDVDDVGSATGAAATRRGTEESSDEVTSEISPCNG